MARSNYALVLWVLLTGSAVAAGSDAELIKEARDSLARGESKAAVIQLKNVLLGNADSIDARILLGEAYLKLGDGASAAKELEKARILKAPAEQWIIQLGRAYLLQNQPKSVLEDIKDGDQYPAELRSHILALRGIAEYESNQDAVAETSLKSALKLDPANTDALLGSAMLEARHQNFSRAIELAGQVLAKDGQNAQAWLVKGESQRLDGNLPGAIESFGKSIELQASDIKARLGRATAYLAQNKLNEAQADVDEVRKRAGDVPMALYIHGVIAFQNKKLQESEDTLLKVINQTPDHKPTQLLLGAIAYEQNELQSADKYLSKFVAVAPEHIPAVKLLAATRLKQGQLKGAIEILSASADKAKADPQYLAMLGSAYLKNKEYDKGNDYLARAAELAPDAAAVRAQLGLGRIASGKLDAGLGDLKSAVEIDPNLVQADVMLVLALIQQKKFDQAITEAEKLKSKSEQNPIAENLLGAAYLAKGDSGKAAEHWRQAIAIKSDYTPASLNLAKLALTQNKPADAVKEYEAVLKQNPKELSALLGLAQIAESQKDFGAMEKRLQEARSANPKAVEPAIMLTRYYLSQNKGLQALEIARSAESENPNIPVLLQNLGMAEMGSGQESQAIATFRRLVNQNPGSPDARNLLAQALFKTGDKTGAGKEWDQVLKDMPDYLPAMIAKAELGMQEKQYPEAQKIADQIKTKFPKAAVGFQLEGDVLNAQKQTKKALAAYEQAYKLAQNSSLAQRIYQIKHESGDAKAASAGLQEWLAKSPGDAGSWLLLALGYQQSGQLKEAAASYEKAGALQPNSVIVLNNLAWIYQELGDSRALATAEKIQLAADSNPELMDTVGWVYLQNNKADKALTLLKQASVMAPHIAAIRVHLAEAMIKTGSKDEGKKELERLLRDNKDFPEKAKVEAMLKQL